jgi:hypothetical protein
MGMQQESNGSGLSNTCDPPSDILLCNFHSGLQHSGLCCAASSSQKAVGPLYSHKGMLTSTGGGEAATDSGGGGDELETCTGTSNILLCELHSGLQHSGLAVQQAALRKL